MLSDSHVTENQERPTVFLSSEESNFPIVRVVLLEQDNVIIFIYFLN